MQSADNAVRGAGLVVLNKGGRNARVSVTLLVVSFNKIAPCIAEDLRAYDEKSANGSSEDFHTCYEFEVQRYKKICMYAKKKLTLQQFLQEP